MIVTAVAVATIDVGILNMDETDSPAATCTEAGTAATEGLLLESDTLMPPGGAGPDSLTTFPAAGTFPTTARAGTLMAASAAGFTMKVACFGKPS
jgi:hypothetical protein